MVYIFIDLVQTAELLTEACNFVRKASEEGKKFLFVGTKRQAAGVIAQEAERCGAHYINQRWLGGFLRTGSLLEQELKD